MATIKLENIEKCYTKDIPVIKNLDLEINEGEFAVIVGPSGCGKSTLLRLIAGLEEVTNGEIYINNKRVTTTVPKDRDISMVFQNYALYPQMTVYENMAFGLKMRNESSEFIKEKIQWASKKLSLDELLSRKPKELSGGQKQRVALGRAIVREPKVFLFDEPLSNLDAKLRIQMRSVIKRLHEELDATMVYVTHDQVEAMTLGTKIIALNEGVIHQVDSPINLYSDPADTFVGKFIGNPGINLIPVNISENFEIYIEGKKKNPIISEEIDTKAIFKKSFKEKVILGIRPEYVGLNEIKNNGDILEGELKLIEPLGNETFYHIKLDDITLISRHYEQKHSDWNLGMKVNVNFNLEKALFFDFDNKKEYDLVAYLFYKKQVVYCRIMYIKYHEFVF